MTFYRTNNNYVPVCYVFACLGWRKLTLTKKFLFGLNLVQFLDKFDTPVMRVFFDKVVDVPVVLCNGVLQVKFIKGYDVPMIMHVLRSAPNLAA